MTKNQQVGGPVIQYELFQKAYTSWVRKVVKKSLP